MTQSSIKSIVVIPGIKGKVKALYKKAYEERGNWDHFSIYPDEAQIFADRIGSCTRTVVGTTLYYNDYCSSMLDDIRTFVTGLGFQLDEIVHECTQEGGGTRYIPHCHVKYNNRELTSNELWLTNLKQKAIDMGYDIQDCLGVSECYMGWGFWGSTIDEAGDDLDDFCNKTGIFGDASDIEFQGGYLYVFERLYAFSLYPVITGT